MNVTPDMAAPIMAKAAMYHGVRRLPEKNPALSARAAGDPCYGEEDGYVAQNGSDNGGGCHKRKFRFELQIYEKSPEKRAKKAE